MSYRITKTRLANRFKTLADLVGWDTEGPAWTPRADGKGNQAKIGYTFLEHNSVYGYSINQLMNDGGGERRFKESCSAAEMDAWLGGAIFAADLIKRGQS